MLVGATLGLPISFLRCAPPLPATDVIVSAAVLASYSIFSAIMIMNYIYISLMKHKQWFTSLLSVVTSFNA